jgi:hypothetical protein
MASAIHSAIRTKMDTLMAVREQLDTPSYDESGVRVRD